jgi:hypothetical protein
MSDPSEKRRRSYQAAAGISKDRMAQDSPDWRAALEQVEAADIVVVGGIYDHVEQVLGALGTPFVMADPESVGSLPLRREQLLVINCPGQIGEAAIPKVRSFVEEGGSLFTTDWALRHVIEPAFPGIVAFNERPTADAVVRVEVADHDNQFLRGVMEAADDPIWWLEASSYPIKLLAPERVQVLITSRELAERWGEPAVAVHFRHGEGQVFHMISHYYLQRTELRTRRHSAPAVAYFAEKGVVPSPSMVAMSQDLFLGDVESAASSSRLMANLVASKTAAEIERVRAERARREREKKAPAKPASGSESVTPDGDLVTGEDG